MTFTPVNELERLLMAAASDPAARPLFYRTLLDQDLYVITAGPVPERHGFVTLTHETPQPVRVIEVEGKPHIPVFTSVERISAVLSGEAGYFALKGRDLLNLLHDKDLVINPGSGCGKFLTREEVNGLNDGSLFNLETPNVDGERMLLGQPSDYPHHITRALVSFFKLHREVKAAYLAHVFFPDVDAAAHTLIGVKVAGDFRAIAEEAGVVVREVTSQGEVVDFIQVDAGAAGAAAAYLQRETKPFYRRRLFGLF